MTRRVIGFGLGFGLVLTLWLSLFADGQTQDSSALVMRISGRIDGGMVPYARRVLQEAEQRGSVVIVHINTPGGRADAATQIRDALLNTPVRTVAFIDKEAFSAGALIALASQEIYMTRGGVIGAAAPVSLSGQAMSEKIVSAIRTLFRATAEHRGRNPEIAEAMVDADVEIPELVKAGKLLTLTTQDALAWDMADGQVDSLDALLKQLEIPDGAVTQTDWNWAEWLVHMLTQWPVAAILLLVGCLALWVEFMEPGFGLGGVIGIICLGLFFGSHHLIGLAGWEEALLIGFGLVFLAVEFFVIPGFGLMGVLGIIALGSGMYLSLLGAHPSSTEVWLAGLSVVSVVILMLIGIFGILAIFTYKPGWSRLSLGERLPPGSGQPPADRSVTHSSWLGASGTTETPLMPSGAGVFRGQRLDIISEGEFVPVDTAVTIVRVEGHRIVVRPSASMAS